MCFHIAAADWCRQSQTIAVDSEAALLYRNLFIYYTVVLVLVLVTGLWQSGRNVQLFAMLVVAETTVVTLCVRQDSRINLWDILIIYWPESFPFLLSICHLSIINLVRSFALEQNTSSYSFNFIDQKLIIIIDKSRFIHSFSKKKRIKWSTLYVYHCLTW